jgi:hypothetical protein
MPMVTNHGREYNTVSAILPALAVDVPIARPTPISGLGDWERELLKCDAVGLDQRPHHAVMDTCPVQRCLCVESREGHDSSPFANLTKNGKSSVMSNDWYFAASSDEFITSIIEALYTAGWNRVRQNRAVDSRFAGRGCMGNNGRVLARRCRSCRVARCTASRDNRRAQSLRTTVPDVGTAVAQEQNRTSRQR